MSNIKDLNIGQQGELIEQYVELITDSMDIKTLEQFVRDTLTDDFNKLSNRELQDEIKYSFDEETLDELVDNVTTNSKELIYTDEQKRLTTLEELGG